MKYTFKYFVLSLVCIAFITGCSDFLNVQPKDKFLGSQVYSTEIGIHNALNGIYIGLAQQSLYGGQLTMSTIDVMAQLYNCPTPQHDWYLFAHYQYDDSKVRSAFDRMWTNAYGLILDINKFINKLKATKGIIPKKNKKILLGEAFGLRAMLHFDMLRVFGPIPGKNPDAPSIPYYTEPTAKPSDILPASTVIDKVLADLKKAENLLSNDPIITKGARPVFKQDGKDFFRRRRYRMNYYAVKALQARVYLWAGEEAKALAAAKTVIKAHKTKGYFPWVKPSDILTAKSPDKVFSSEVIFAVQNKNLYKRQRELFYAGLRGTSILAPRKID